MLHCLPSVGRRIPNILAIGCEIKTFVYADGHIFWASATKLNEGPRPNVLALSVQNKSTWTARILGHLRPN